MSEKKEEDLVEAVAAAVKQANSKWLETTDSRKIEKLAQAVAIQKEAMKSDTAMRLRATLTSYYQQHAPSNLDNVESLVARVVGGPPSKVGNSMVGGIVWTEEELLGKIQAKYGAPMTHAAPITELAESNAESKVEKATTEAIENLTVVTDQCKQEGNVPEKGKHRVYESTPRTLSMGKCFLSETREPIQRLDFNSDGSAFVLKNFMSKEECEYIIASSEMLGFTSCGYHRNIRITDRVSAMAEDLASHLFTRAKPYLVNMVVGGDSECEFGVPARKTPGLYEPVSLNPCFRVCRYDRNGFFSPHHDGGFEQSKTCSSIKTFMIYLNDGYEGGTTNFYTEDQDHYVTTPGKENLKFVYKPQQGSCLVFNHAITHDGGVLTGEGDKKYILRTEVMYQHPPSDSHLSDSSDSGSDSAQQFPSGYFKKGATE